MLEIVNIEKSFGARKLIELDRFVLSPGDKVAVVGENGSGKTTLLKIIAGQIQPDKGRVIMHGTVGMIAQFGDRKDGMDSAISGRLGIGRGDIYSGGEKTKARIAGAFSSRPDILLADEPTTNLDISGIRALEELLLSYRGGLMIVSHDRALLRKVCGKVLEIDRGVCRLYGCGYDDYLIQKALEIDAHWAGYNQYVSEKNRLKRAAAAKARASERVKRTPRRMGNSEARLHKMGDQGAKQKLDRASKAALTRLDQLEKVEKPWEQKDIVFDVRADALHSPVLVRVNDVSQSFGGKTVLAHCSFDVPNHKKTALIGDNGTGKTTIIDMIAQRAGGIETCRHLRIGYFKQDTSNLDDEKSVLENAMESAVYGESFVRTILSRLLFLRDEVSKKAGLLSGGERIKLSLARIILSEYNLLVLDEPTNFLDIASRDALESVLAAYPGAVLFVSHDRAFISRIADRIICIRDRTTHTFEGRFESFEKQHLSPET